MFQVLPSSFPGPWPTFEIQLPQDDFHLLAWQLGEQIPTADLPTSRTTYHLRGLESEETLLKGMCPEMHSLSILVSCACTVSQY